MDEALPITSGLAQRRHLPRRKGSAKSKVYSSLER